jgi:multidrug transporter EmrE-like cation transporter
MKWLLLVVSLLANASASVLIKIAGKPPRLLPSLETLPASLLNLPFLGGVVLYGVAFITYAVALTRLPLNIVHPILTAGALALVALASVFLFQEEFTWQRGAGLILITIGVALIATKAS